MSKEAFEQMMQTAKDDPKLQGLLESADGFERVVNIGAEKGYYFTEDEIQEVLQNKAGISSSESDELSDEALEAVAGGWFENLRIRFGNNPPINIRQW